MASLRSSVWQSLRNLMTLTLLLSTRFCAPSQTPMPATVASQILSFDDINTDHGWAGMPANYSFLDFGGLLAFKPSDPELDGLISTEDLNCAASSPNALYGTRYNFDSGFAKGPTEVPFIALSSTTKASGSRITSFELRKLKIKPLDMPLAYTSISLRGHKSNNETVEWGVDVPAGFHDILEVDIVRFSRHSWAGLTKLELWADFHHAEMVLDWEYCLDDLEVIFETGYP